MNFPILASSLASLALLVAPVHAQSSELCLGASFDPAVPSLSPVFTSIGFNGDQFTIAQTGAYVADGGPGGAKVFGIDPGTGTVSVVDDFAVPGIGRGFGREVLGAALASSGAVLVARREPAPSAARLYQIRRSGTTGSVQVSALEATNNVTWVEGNRRFDSDGDRAVLTSWKSTGTGLGQFVSLDFFGVNAAGDWFLEDTVRAARASIVYSLHDVQIEGDQVVLEVFGINQSAVAFERASSGRWQELDLPRELTQAGPSDVVLSGDLLAGRFVNSDETRVDVYTRLGSGGWSLTRSIPFAASPSDPFVLTNLQAAGDRLSFALFPLNSSLPWETYVYRRTPTGDVTLQAQFPGALRSLSKDYGIVTFGLSEQKAVRLDDLVGEVRICDELGTVACVPQRAGSLSYLDLGLNGGATPSELVLQTAPAGVPTYVLATIGQIPSAGQLDSLCIDPNAPVIRLPLVAETSAVGTARWLIDPGMLPLAAGGTTSGIGAQWTFQAVVRSSLGTATSRAIVVDL